MIEVVYCNQFSTKWMNDPPREWCHIKALALAL